MSYPTNPYAAPLSTAEVATPADFRDVFLSWERLRVFCNAILAAIALACGIGSYLDMSYWENLVFGAIAANVCFCTAPVIEGYATYLVGNRARMVRWPLLALGVLISIPLTIMTVPPVFLFGGMFGGN